MVGWCGDGFHDGVFGYVMAGGGVGWLGCDGHFVVMVRCGVWVAVGRLCLRCGVVVFTVGVMVTEDRLGVWSRWLEARDREVGAGSWVPLESSGLNGFLVSCPDAVSEGLASRLVGVGVADECRVLLSGEVVDLLFGVLSDGEFEGLVGSGSGLAAFQVLVSPNAVRRLPVGVRAGLVSHRCEGVRRVVAVNEGFSREERLLALAPREFGLGDDVGWFSGCGGDCGPGFLRCFSSADKDWDVGPGIRRMGWLFESLGVWSEGEVLRVLRGARDPKLWDDFVFWLGESWDDLGWLVGDLVGFVPPVGVNVSNMCEWSFVAGDGLLFPTSVAVKSVWEVTGDVVSVLNALGGGLGSGGVNEFRFRELGEMLERSLWGRRPGYVGSGPRWGSPARAFREWCDRYPGLGSDPGVWGVVEEFLGGDWLRELELRVQDRSAAVGLLQCFGFLPNLVAVVRDVFPVGLLAAAVPLALDRFWLDRYPDVGLEVLLGVVEVNPDWLVDEVLSVV